MCGRVYELVCCIIEFYLFVLLLCRLISLLAVWVYLFVYLFIFEYKFIVLCWLHFGRGVNSLRERWLGECELLLVHKLLHNYCFSAAYMVWPSLC